MRVARAAAEPRLGPPRDSRRRLAHRGEAQLIGVLLAPLEATLLAIDSQAQPVLLAGRYLARPQHAARPVFEPSEHVHVVVEPAARHEAAQVRELPSTLSGSNALTAWPGVASTRTVPICTATRTARGARDMAHKVPALERERPRAVS